MALVLLQLAVWYVGDSGDISSLRAFQWVAIRTVGIYGLIALGYWIWPKKAPDGAEGEQRPALAQQKEGARR